MIFSQIFFNAQGTLPLLDYWRYERSLFAVDASVSDSLHNQSLIDVEIRVIKK